MKHRHHEVTAPKETPQHKGQGAKEEQDALAIVCVARPFDKRVADLQAEAALMGVQVDPVNAGAGRLHFVVRRGGRAIDCADLDAARRAVQRLAGGAA